MKASDCSIAGASATAPSRAETLRRVVHGLACSGTILASLPAYVVMRMCGGNSWRPRWQQSVSKGFLWSCGIHVEVSGNVPRSGLLVCNHLSYLDIVVIGSVCPAVFVSKSDVRSWPVFGQLARMAGTIFIDRTRRGKVSDSVRAIGLALRNSVPVVLFPEGTSSDGATVLPFRSSLLESAVQQADQITPAAIDYCLEDGSVAEDVCYWGDMVFLTHLVNLLGKRHLRAFLRFGTPMRAGGDRKQLARKARDRVIQLRHIAGPANR